MTANMSIKCLHYQHAIIKCWVLGWVNDMEEYCSSMGLMEHQLFQVLENQHSGLSESW